MCTDCGTEKLRKVIEDGNEELLNLTKNIKWYRWQLVEGESTPTKTEVKGTLRAAVNEFLSIVEDLSSRGLQGGSHPCIGSHYGRFKA